MRNRMVLVLASVVAIFSATVPATGANSTPGPRLAYSSSSGSHIEVLHPDRPYGAALPRIEVVAVAGELHWLSGPSWSPTGRWLTYGDTLGVVEPIAGEVRIVNVTTRRARTVLTLPSLAVLDVAWSPRGDRIAFSTSSAYTPVWGLALSHLSVHVVGVDGSGYRVVGTGTDPAWSPDGGRLAYSGTTGIELVDIDDVGAPRTVGYPLDGGFSPRWSPDGRRIAFLSARLLGSPQLVVADADGTHVVPLPVTTWSLPTWSPDSRLLAYEDRGLAVIAADGNGRPRRLHWEEDGNAHWPEWGSHGAIAYVRSGMIRVSDPATGENEPVHHGSPDPWLVWAPSPGG